MKSADVKAEPGESMARLQSIQIEEPLHEHADEALRFVEQHRGFTYTPEQDKAVQRKIDRHLMPLVSDHSQASKIFVSNGLQLFLSYLFQYMDKSIMAQSLVYGLRQDLHLVGQQYSWCG